MAVDREIKFILIGKDKLTHAIKAANKAVGGLSGAMKIFGTIAKAAGLAAIAAIGALVLAITALISFTKKSIAAFTAYATKVDDVQDVLGGTAENASRLVGQFRLTSVSVDAATNAMKFFSKNLDAAQQGQTSMLTTFKRLGVAIRDQNGDLRDADEMMMDVRDALSKMRDGQAKTAVVMKLFGRGGAAIMDWLEKSPKYIREVNRRLEKLGLILGEDSLKAMRRYKRAQADMALAWDAVKIAAGKALIPIVTNYLQKLANWVTNNMPTINTWFQTFAGWAQTAADWLAKNLTKGVQGLLAWIQENGPGILSFLNSVKDAIIWIAGNMPSIRASKPIGGAPPRTTILNPHRRAVGAVVTRPEVALVGEGGPEAIIPLTGGGGGMGASVVLNNCTLVGSGHDAGRAIAKVLDDYYRRRARGA